MRILIRTAFLFTVLLSAVTVLALQVGREQPISEELALLRLSDCAPPCWLGIQPGITTLEQAKASIAAQFNNTSPYTIKYKSTPPEVIDFVMYKRSNPRLGIEVLMVINGRDQNQPIDTIRLFFTSFSDFDLPLGTLVNALGSPQYFWVKTTLPNPVYGVSLAYANSRTDGVFVGITCSSRINLDRPAGWVDFSALPPTPTTGATVNARSDLEGFKTWRGFADYSRYDIPAGTSCVP